MATNAPQEITHFLSLFLRGKFRQLLRELFKQENPSGLVQLFRYGFVALAAYAVDFGLLVLLVSGFGVHYLVAATISFIFGVTVNYFLARKWVFTHSRYSPRTEMIGVLLIGFVGLILNGILLALFTDWLGWFYVHSKLVSTVIVFFWNFFARHIFLRPAKETSL
jgi:putative flippase GtrA